MLILFNFFFPVLLFLLALSSLMLGIKRDEILFSCNFSVYWINSPFYHFGHGFSKLDLDLGWLSQI